MSNVALLNTPQYFLSQQIGYNCQAAGVNALLTDATVGSADTNAGLQAAVTAAVVHASFVPMKSRINRAIQAGLTDGTLTDALIAPLTTVAGLVALTAAGASVNTNIFIE